MSKRRRELQDLVLKRRGLQRAGRGRLVTTPVPPPDGRKTLAMRILESKFSMPIEALLQGGTLQEVADKLGIDFTTVSLWRKRLGLR